MATKKTSATVDAALNPDAVDPAVAAFVQRQKQWPAEAARIREVMHACGLGECLKWGKPTFTLQDGDGDDSHNIAIIQPFKESIALMFFKGALMKDPKGVLVPPGPNSRHGARIEFTSLADVEKHTATLKAYVKEAVALAKSGAKVEPLPKAEVAVPDELTAAFKKSAALKKAFAALTPGRQRAYILHFAGAKQSATRSARIEKCTPAILDGKGFNER